MRIYYCLSGEFFLFMARNLNSSTSNDFDDFTQASNNLTSNLKQLNSKLEWLYSRIDIQSFQVFKIEGIELSPLSFKWLSTYTYPVVLNV